MGVTPGQRQLDNLTLNILKGLSSEARLNARQSAGQILEVASAFLSKQAHEALSNFYKLYFDQALQEKKEQINDDVSRLFEEAQALMASGGADAVDGLQDDADRSRERVGIAHFQKQLEALITLDADFKERLVPVLSSMQFEDAMNQRISHIDLAWTSTMEALAAGDAAALESAARTAAAALSSDAERLLFYPGVLKEPPPEGLGEQGIWLDLSA